MALYPHCFPIQDRPRIRTSPGCRRRILDGRDSGLRDVHSSWGDVGNYFSWDIWKSFSLTTFPKYLYWMTFNFTVNLIDWIFTMLPVQWVEVRTHWRRIVEGGVRKTPRIERQRFGSLLRSITCVRWWLATENRGIFVRLSLFLNAGIDEWYT